MARSEAPISVVSAFTGNWSRRKDSVAFVSLGCRHDIAAVAAQRARFARSQCHGEADPAGCGGDEPDAKSGIAFDARFSEGCACTEAGAVHGCLSWGRLASCCAHYSEVLRAAALRREAARRPLPGSTGARSGDQQHGRGASDGERGRPRALLWLDGLDLLAVAVATGACLCAGVVVVPVAPPRSSSRAELDRGKRAGELLDGRLQQSLTHLARAAARVLDVVKPSIIISTERSLGKLGPPASLCGASPWARTVETILLAPAEFWSLPPAPPDWQAPVVSDSSAWAVLQCTSGSTRRPRAVVLTHGNLAAACRNIVAGFAVDEVALLSWLPLYHDMGFIGHVAVPFWCAATGGQRCCSTLLPTQQFLSDPALWLLAAGATGCNVSGGPNFSYDLCTQHVTDDDLDNAEVDLSQWSVVYNGADRIAPATVGRFHGRFARWGLSTTAVPCYGLAEAVLYVSSCKYDASVPGGSGDACVAVAAKVGGGAGAADDDELPVLAPVERMPCGRASDFLELRIVSPTSCREVLREGEVGEVWLKGGAVSSVGYLDEPELTTMTFNGELHGAHRDGGGFLRTGDLGFLRRGQLYIVGRMRDSMQVRGRTHVSADLEETAFGSHVGLRPRSVAFLRDGDGEGNSVVLLQEVSRSLLRRLELGSSPDGARALAAMAHSMGDAARQAIAQRHGVVVDAVVLLRPGAVLTTTSGKVMRTATANAFLRGDLLQSTLLVVEAPKVTLVPTPPGAPVDEAGSLALAATVGWVFGGRADRAFVDRIADVRLCDAGLDSLQLVRLHGAFRARYGEAISLDDLTRMTSRELAALDRSTAPPEIGVDLAARCSEVWDTLVGDAWSSRTAVSSHTGQESPRHVLLTGATGFVGAFLLHHVLSVSDSRGVQVTCLVREVTGLSLRDRLQRNLSLYGLELSAELEARVHVVKGDVTQPNLGMECSRARDSLQRSIDVVIHCAAVDSFVQPYEVVARTNVDGTARVLAFAAGCEGIAHVAHISSCGAALAAQSAPTDRTRGLYNGYSQSKLVAEGLCARARADGAPVTAYRLGYLVDTTDAPVAEEDTVEQVLLLCADMRAVPSMPGATLDLCPVTFAVETVWRRVLASALGGPGSLGTTASSSSSGSSGESLTWGRRLGVEGVGGRLPGWLHRVHHPDPVPWRSVVSALLGAIESRDAAESPGRRGSIGSTTAEQNLAVITVLPLADWLKQARRGILDTVPATTWPSLGAIDSTGGDAAAGALGAGVTEGAGGAGGASVDVPSGGGGGASSRLGGSAEGGAVDASAASCCGAGRYSLLPLLSDALPAQLAVLFSAPGEEGGAGVHSAAGTAVESERGAESEVSPWTETSLTEYITSVLA